MNIEPKKVWVVGHKNPDTDSICAAISYAYLKNQLGERQYVQSVPERSVRKPGMCWIILRWRIQN